MLDVGSAFGASCDGLWYTVWYRCQVCGLDVGLLCGVWLVWLERYDHKIRGHLRKWVVS
jgi:hypothetical protein